jgi:hypothetical protein
MGDRVMHLLPAIILLYVGPDQTMPIASYLVTLIGVVLIFWSKVYAWVRWVLDRFKKTWLRLNRIR